jgi:phosphatidylserine/phosphatidylglycerophosphate/cardiolipin synthase-like enzyme
MTAKSVDEHGFQFAATFPSEVDATEFPSVVEISDEVRRLFFDADDIVRIANPYFDPAETVMGDIASLAGRGMETRILTRETSTGTTGLAETLNEINRSIPVDRQSNFIVRDLFERDTATGRQTVATHAKIAIADSNLCYIGSANLTRTGLESNFEFGVIIRGERVAQAIDVYDRMFEMGTEVSLPI